VVGEVGRDGKGAAAALLDFLARAREGVLPARE
jgi:hypothetical protein